MKKYSNLLKQARRILEVLEARTALMWCIEYTLTSSMVGVGDAYEF